MTKDLDMYYGVTVYHAEKIGPRRWRAKGEIFRRDTFKVLETFYTEGGAMTSADSRALTEAEHIVAHWGIPENWQGPKEKF